jgi:translation initiation factor 1 (eIF-1/SUI1)
MTSKNPTAQQRANIKYETEKRGKVVMRVQLTPSDDNAHWEQIKKDFVKKYGSAKQAIHELHAKAKKEGEFGN